MTRKPKPEVQSQTVTPTVVQPGVQPTGVGSLVFEPALGRLSFSGTTLRDSVTLQPYTSGTQKRVRCTLYTRDEQGNVVNREAFDILESDLKIINLVGGEGDDNFYNYTGVPATMSGGGGKDFLKGGNGADYLEGGPGVNRLEGKGGDDTIVGGNATDFAYGGTGNDQLSGGEDRDYLYGEEGHDTLVGGPGNDTLSGGNGNDVEVP